MKKNIYIEPVLQKLKDKDLVILDSKIVLFTKDCIVIEHYTGKTYTYRVINYLTGDSKYLFHKRIPVTDDEHALLKNKVKQFKKYGCYYPTNGEEMIRFIFEQVFRLFGYSMREEQIELSIHMYKTITTGNISLSDVPVGLGKTHAYLVAAIIHNIYDNDSKSNTVIITTSSIELQKAIVKDYLPEISDMLLQFGIIDRPLTSVIRKGKDNYLCDLRLKNYIKNIDIKKKKLDELLVLRKIETLDEIDLDEIKGLTQYDRKRICVNYNSCQVCLQKNLCRYQKFMKCVRKPDLNFQVCNHNYYLADVIRRRRNLSPLLPGHSVIIIDEAHKLIDAARQMYGSNISQREVYTLAKRTIPKSIKSKESKHLKYLGEDLIKYSTMLFKELVNNIPKHINRDDTEKFETILSSIGRVYLSRMISNIEEIQRLSNSEDKKYSSELRRCVNDLKVFHDWRIVYWIEKPFLKGQCIFASIPIALSKELGNDLWQEDDCKILTSGTLAVKKDFEYMKSKIGMKAASQSRVLQVCKPSPFDYKENCLLHIPKRLPYPSDLDDNYLTEIANKIEQLVKASNGHAMVLFTSYKPMKIVFELLKHRLRDNKLVLMSRGKKGSINDFKATNKGVLFATGSAWEGINLPGDVLSHLIIVKLPFPIPDPISEYERTMYATLDDYIQAVVVPQMLIKLRQGVGRLIRKETDTGVISILDVRTSEGKRYHDIVIDALPDCKLVNHVHEIEQFLKMKKDNDFFV